ncbi:MAG: hypothetical protein ACJ71K_17060 [Nitrososphaeraceae archaeon]
MHSVIKYEHTNRQIRLRSLNLDAIEQHCKYHEPEVHKAAIFKELGEIGKGGRAD